MYLTWSPQTDLAPQCQNRPTPVLVTYYQINPDRSAVLLSATRYVLDHQHPKITIPVPLTFCDLHAMWIAVGNIQPLQTIANVDQTLYPYDRPGVSYSFLDGVPGRCNPPPSPTPTPSPSPSPSP
jgi:hypothetical protein